MISSFPSPAQGYESNSIDLNRLLIKHPSATVFMKIETSRYSNIGIYNGDLLIVDRAKKISQNSLVIYESEVVMITLLNLQPAQLQGYLWIDPKEDIKKKNLVETVDEISSIYGRRSITLGKSFIKDGWQMKREFLSPCSTTDINNIPMVW